MVLSLKITNEQIAALRTKLNVMYDDVEKLDAQIDLMILKRNNLINQIESGVAVMIKYEDVLR